MEKFKYIMTVPTETVEGYAVPLMDTKAVQELMRVKERDFDSGKVFTLVPESIEAISKYAVVDGLARTLISRYFPGELTLILPKNPNFRHFYYDHFDTIGIRVPNHAEFLKLLQKTGPILLTSANPKGGTPRSLTGHRPSTIIDLSMEQPQILRQGELTIDLEKIKQKCSWADNGDMGGRMNKDDAMLGAARPRLKLVLHNIRSCVNVGAILRTAEGFGVDEVVLSGYTPRVHDPEILPHLRAKLDKEIHKTALGAEDMVKIYSSHDIFQDLKNWRKVGWKIIGLENNIDSTPLLMLNDPRLKEQLGDQVILILGEEVHGIDYSLYDIIDLFVEIPMRGQKESFNVSVAAGIAMYGIMVL